MNNTLLYGLFFQGIGPLASEHLLEHQEISNYSGASWLGVTAEEDAVMKLGEEVARKVAG